MKSSPHRDCISQRSVREIVNSQDSPETKVDKIRLLLDPNQGEPLYMKGNNLMKGDKITIAL